MTITIERPKKFGALKFGFAAAAAAALTIGGLTPAYAADYQLDEEDIAGFEIGGDTGNEAGYNYDQWHIGSTTTPGTPVSDWLEFGDCSVTMLNPGTGPATQILKGFEFGAGVNERIDTAAEAEALFASLAVTMESGSVTLQVPFEIDRTADADRVVEWGTMRNTVNFTTDDTHWLRSDTQLISSKGPGSTDDRGWPSIDHGTVSEFLAGLAELEVLGVPFELLGFGITGSDGTVVNSVSALGDTYYFGRGDCLPEADTEIPVDSEDSDDAETPAAPVRPVLVETGL